MRRNCKLELQLFPSYSSDHHHNNQPIMEASRGGPKIEQLYYHDEQQQHKQKEQHNTLTIFYDGKMCVSDVTELQAKAILMLANKEIEERVERQSGLLEPSTPTVVESHQPLYSPLTPLSMKRSLQQFLQKRNIRKQEASPYYNNNNH